MWEVSPLSQKMERVMDASSDVGKSVSLGVCICDADLCGRQVAGGSVFTSCGLEALYVSITYGAREKERKARTILRGR